MRLWKDQTLIDLAVVVLQVTIDSPTSVRWPVIEIIRAVTNPGIARPKPENTFSFQEHCDTGLLESDVRIPTPRVLGLGDFQACIKTVAALDRSCSSTKN